MLTLGQNFVCVNGGGLTDQLKKKNTIKTEVKSDQQYCDRLLKYGKNVLLFRNVLAAPLHCNIMVCEIFCMGFWTFNGA